MFGTDKTYFQSGNVKAQLFAKDLNSRTETE